MARAIFDPLKVDIELDHAETQALLSAGLSDEFKKLVEGALVAAGVAAVAIGPVTAVIYAYVAVELAIIRRMDRGDGVVLRVPWLLGLVIPMPRSPQTNTPNSAWATSNDGVFIGAAGDLVTWQIERGAIEPGVAIFRLRNEVPTGWPPGTRPWNKAFWLRDGLGGQWAIEAAAHSSAENGLYADQLTNGQSFTFTKPGFLNIWTTAFEISGIENVHGGDRVTFTWTKDWI